MRRQLLIWIGPLCSLLLLGAALTVLYHLTHLWHWHDIRQAIWSQPLPQLGGALLLTLLSYGCLCCYDLLALKVLDKRLPWQQAGMQKTGLTHSRTCPNMPTGKQSPTPWPSRTYHPTRSL